jgi:hypothetical protein
MTLTETIAIVAGARGPEVRGRRAPNQGRRAAGQAIAVRCNSAKKERLHD